MRFRQILAISVWLHFVWGIPCFSGGFLSIPAKVLIVFFWACLMCVFVVRLAMLSDSNDCKKQQKPDLV